MNIIERLYMYILMNSGTTTLLPFQWLRKHGDYCNYVQYFAPTSEGLWLGLVLVIATKENIDKILFFATHNTQGFFR